MKKSEELIVKIQKTQRSIDSKETPISFRPRLEANLAKYISELVDAERQEKKEAEDEASRKIKEAQDLLKKAQEERKQAEEKEKADKKSKKQSTKSAVKKLATQIKATKKAEEDAERDLKSAKENKEKAEKEAKKKIEKAKKDAAKTLIENKKRDRLNALKSRKNKNRKGTASSRATGIKKRMKSQAKKSKSLARKSVKHSIQRKNMLKKIKVFNSSGTGLTAAERKRRDLIRDSKRHANAPGFHKTNSQFGGYYEKRANRTDISKRARLEDGGSLYNEGGKLPKYAISEKLYYLPKLSGFKNNTLLIVDRVRPAKPDGTEKEGFYYGFKKSNLMAHESDLSPIKPKKMKDGGSFTDYAKKFYSQTKKATTQAYEAGKKGLNKATALTKKQIEKAKKSATLSYMNSRKNLNKEEKSAINKAKNIIRKKFEGGGSLGYEGKSPEQVWKGWDGGQRLHFIIDHTGKQHTEATQLELSQKAYNFLPVTLKEKIKEHISSPQYKDGGNLYGNGGTLNKYKLYFHERPSFIIEANSEDHADEIYRTWTTKEAMDNTGMTEEMIESYEGIEPYKIELSNETDKKKDGGQISRKKARQILHEGKAHGVKITDEQRKFFGARASGYPVKK